jgi:putative tricarboxylic transport membrane protein
VSSGIYCAIVPTVVKTVLLVVVVTASALLHASCRNPSAGGRYPARPIEFIVAGGPGGGLDIVARMVDDVGRRERMGATFLIANRDGGGGNVARAYLGSKKGDDHVLLSESNRVWLSELMGTTSAGIESTTPLARLTSDPLVWAVRSDSKFHDAQSVIEAVKRDPDSVRFGVGTIPSDDQFNVLRPLRASGVDMSALRMAAFRSGGDLMTNLLGGHVDVVSASFSEAEGQVAAGRVRMLATASEVRMTAAIAASVPTWRELGFDVTITHWRGVFGPPGMSREAVRYWNEYFAKLVRTEAWKATLTRIGQQDAYLGADEFTAALVEERELYKPLVSAFLSQGSR